MTKSPFGKSAKFQTGNNDLGVGNRFVTRVDMDESTLAFLRNIMQPPQAGGDRTEISRNRYRERRKAKSRKAIGDIIADVPVITKPGTIKIQVAPDREPTWHPGRDAQGDAGRQRGRKASNEPGDYIEVSYEEFVDLFLDYLELPNMLKKRFASTTLPTEKVRGVTRTGVRQRLNKVKTAAARLKRAVVKQNINAGQSGLVPGAMPSVIEVPFENVDLRYNRIAPKPAPCSNAVVALILDRSGSMSGNPLVIAKAYFLLCVLFLKTRYRQVEILMISHDTREYLWKTEEEFFKIGGGGGTVAACAWDLLLRIVENGAVCKQTGVRSGPYPSNAWNRYMFQASDGQLFDGAESIARHWSKIIQAPFNHAGYLEVGNSFSSGRYENGFEAAGQVLSSLPPAILAHTAIGRAESLNEVPEAFRQILRTEGAQDHY